MENKFRKQKTWLLIIILLFLIFTIFHLFKSHSYKTRLNNERLKSEMLLSEKLQLEKNIEKMDKKTHDLLVQISDLEIQKKGYIDEIAKKESEINKLNGERSASMKLRKKLTDIETSQEKLINELGALKKAYAELQQENNTLKSKISDLENDDDYVSYKSGKITYQTLDNCRVEALRGRKAKLTANAKRTNKLVVYFEVPDFSSNNLNFKLVTPEGKKLSSKTDLSTQVKISEKSTRTVIDTFIDEGNAEVQKKLIELTYIPIEKLGNGIYQYEVYNDSKYLGNIQLRLK